jgi:hypothetical protein
MSSETSLEQRLAAVERAITDLERRFAGAATPSNWLVEVTGSVTDGAAFREVLEIGRAFRSADLPPDEPDEKM